MDIEYVATEFAGDPPSPIARWYKVQAGTYARRWPEGTEFFNAAQLNVEQSLGVYIEFVRGDSKPEDIAEIEAAWAARR